jgi:predicted TIM-barrel fold metal-dependent hydrolase
LVTGKDDPVNFAEKTAHGLLGNVRTITCIAMRGVCHRFPRLKFVSVESGAGYLPYVIQNMDWQFENTAIWKAHPEWERPSEYFRRQIYGTFWFERLPAEVLAEYQDNLMFETDYPHPTSLSPGPASSSPPPAQVVKDHLGSVDDSVVRKVTHDNAARLYRLD